MNIKIILKNLSIFCFVYGTIMLFTNITKTFFVLWVISGVIFLIFYYLFKINIFNKFIYSVIIFVMAIGFIILIIGSIEISLNMKYREKDNLDYIIVLGALVLDDGPSLSTIYRLDSAIDYMNRNDNTICILSGAKGENEPDTEAKIMSEYMIKKGIPYERLILEEQSTNTYDNLLFSSKFVDINNDDIGIVTNNFHVSRAIFISKKIGYKNVYGIPAYSLPINLISNYIRESIALFYYKIKLLFL